jgi:hypothetical protein
VIGDPGSHGTATDNKCFYMGFHRAAPAGLHAPFCLKAA